MNIKQNITRYLFACGVPRSGTTLLQRMLNSHPELAVANDTLFIPRALEMTVESPVEAAPAGSPIPLPSDLAGNLDQYHESLGSTPHATAGSLATSGLAPHSKRPI